MKFCDKCGAIMLPRKTDDGQVLACAKCGYAKVANLEEYKIVKKMDKKNDEVAVIEEGSAGLSTTRAKCPSCGHDKAYWWIRQTRRADEPSTRFYRCVKCGKTWREYA